MSPNATSSPSSTLNIAAMSSSISFSLGPAKHQRIVSACVNCTHGINGMNLSQAHVAASNLLKRICVDKYEHLQHSGAALQSPHLSEHRSENNTCQGTCQGTCGDICHHQTPIGTRKELRVSLTRQSQSSIRQCTQVSTHKIPPG